MPTPLSPEKLRRTYDCDNLDFETTAELPSGTQIIGQPRGVQAIDFGLKMQNEGYNIYVLGESGTGRTTAIKTFVENHAGKSPLPSDWVYVHNFVEPYKPLAISFPAGEACGFRDRLQQFIQQLRNEIARAFDTSTFRDAVLEVRHKMDNEREAVFLALHEQALGMDAALMSTKEGYQIIPTREGQALQQEEFAALSEEQQAQRKETQHQLEHELNEALHQARKIELGAESEMDELKRQVAGSVVDVAMQELKSHYGDFERIIAYLDKLHKDILDNVDLFRTRNAEEGGGAEDAADPRFRRYQVNVLVDHQHSKHAPVIVEYDPNVSRLLGRVEHEALQGGAIVTDFTLIRSGTLHAANGGYLVLRANDLFAEDGAWDGLKRALVGTAVRPDDPATRGGTAVRSLDPETIPLKLKVILIGPPGLYYDLYSFDEDFRRIFKVMADFDERVVRTAENELDYATFVATRVREEGLLHLERDAIGRVIEYGSRLAGTQNRLSTRFGHIADLVREADFWAKEAANEVVTVGDIEKAIDHRQFLNNRVETLMRESLVEGKQLVATSGAVVGQINGLAVSQVGEHAFGHPSRLTARTYVGRAGVVQIDREVQMAGPTHNKGVLTIVGYLGGQYADDQPLSLSAQLTFEQNYGGIDGDSASSTELYALISSLSNIPIDQGIAVTGSVNQNGEIQAIGGATHKVEGWFEVCRAQGFTGKQGVIIPASNVQDLMLRVSVVKAVEAGKFNVWAVERIDEGLELLLGRPAAEIHAAAKGRLVVLADILKRHGGYNGYE